MSSFEVFRPNRTVLRAAGAVLMALLYASPPAWSQSMAGGSTALAQADDVQPPSNGDPLEALNRPIFKFDTTLDKYALRPVAKAYRDNVPAPARNAMTNVLRNIESPVILANDLLQGDMPKFGDTFARLWLNTILGLGGFIDVGGKAGIPFHDADFGQTLGVWGVEPGPYLVLPVLGPSDTRDAFGMAVDSVLSPWGYEMRMAHIGTENSIAHTTAKVVDGRSKHIEDLDELQRNSLDFYATTRSLYQQRRSSMVAAAGTGHHERADASGHAIAPAMQSDDPDFLKKESSQDFLAMRQLQQNGAVQQIASEAGPS